MAFSPRAGAVISFVVEGAQAAQRQIETIGGSFNRVSTLASAGLKALAAGYAAWNIGAYVKDSTLLAARYETLGIVMRTAGENAGYSRAQMDSFEKGLEKSGISMMKSREAMIAMTTANLDNNKSLELGRLAQNLAVVANKSSSEALTDLIANIQQADTEGLKFMGIILNQEEALQKYAAAHGTVTKALTQTQKSEAIQAAVMQEGAKYAGIYEKAMGTAGKALGSLDRYFENIKVRLGTPFLEGFAQGVFGVTDGVKQLNKQLEELEKNGTMEKAAKSIGSTVGAVISTVRSTVEIVGQFATGIATVGQAAADFFDDYLGGMATVKIVTVAFAVLLSGFMIEQAVIGFNAVSAAAWGATLKVQGAFLAMGAAAANFFRALLLSAALTGWSATILLGARMLVAGLVTTIASIPGAVGAAVVAAGLGVGYLFAKAFGDQLGKLMPKFIDDAVSKGVAWVVSKTSDLPEVSEAVERDKPDDAKAAAAKAEKDGKERLMREMNNAVVAAESQISSTAAASTRLKALNELRDQQLKQSLDQRIITQADYLQKKRDLDLAEAQGQLDQIAAQKAQLGAYIAAFQAGAPLGQGRDPAADANEMIKLSGEEAAAQTRLNAVKQSYAYQIAGAVIESYTNEFGSISSIVDAQEQLVRATRQNLKEAGRSAEQRETLSALRMQSAADELSAELEAKHANGTATREYVQNTSAMITALSQMGQARLKAVGSDVSASFINDTKAMRDDTVALYADMKNTFLGTEDERVRAAADASIRLAEIRRRDADAAIDKTNDTDAQKLLAKQKVQQAYNDYVKSVNENADAKALQSSRGFETLQDAISSAFDVNRIESFGQAMTDAFGTAGAALGGLIDAFTLYDQRQRDNEAARKAASIQYKNEAGKLAAAQSAITMKQQREELGYYASVAGAAKGFFKEKTAGYKVLETVERTYRAFELAMEIKNMAVKSGLLTTFTGLFVTSKATQTGVETAATGASVANAGAQASAWGVTAVVKAIASMPFPLNIAAGAATLAAVVAIGAKMMGGLGGGSAPSLSEQRQASQGTGSVLGAPTSKSESIARSLELSLANSNIELTYTADMLRSLRSIESSLSGLGGVLIRAGVDGIVPATTGVGGGWLGKVGNSIFGGKTEALDTGVMSNRTTVAGVLAGGLNAQKYTDMKKDGGWFHSDKRWTDTQSLGAATNQQFSAAIAGMVESVKEAGSLLGIEGAAFNQRLNSFVVDFGKISFKGMSGDDIQKALEGVFSKIADDMAQWSVQGLTQFQKVGEGHLETLVRISANYANLDASLKAINMTFGATGMSSIAARESLISLVGGMDELSSKTTSFGQNFLTEQERLAPLQKYVTEQLAKMGLSYIDTREEFKNHVLGLKLVTEAEQQQFAQLMDLESAFAKVTAQAKDLTRSAQDIADERADLQSQWDELTMTSAELHAKARLAIDPSNRALFDQIALQRSLKDSAQATSEALASTVERLGATKTSTLAYRDSLMLGSLSTLSPMQKYVETQRQYNEQVQKALANPADSTAASAAQSAATAWLTASQVVNASSSAFAGDRNKVLGDMEQLAAIAGVQMTDAQRQLSVLDKQVDRLDQLNDTAAAIQSAIVNQGAPGEIAMPVFDAQRYAASSSEGVLASEVKALRAENAEQREINAAVLAELKLLRGQQHQETGDQINAQARATADAALQIGKAVVSAFRSSSSEQRVAPE